MPFLSSEGYISCPFSTYFLPFCLKRAGNHQCEPHPYKENKPSEFPDVIFSVKNSLFWPFPWAFVIFWVEMSGISEVALNKSAIYGEHCQPSYIQQASFRKLLLLLHFPCLICPFLVSKTWQKIYSDSIVVQWLKSYVSYSALRVQIRSCLKFLKVSIVITLLKTFKSALPWKS